MSAPLTHLGGEPDHVQTEHSLDSNIDSGQAEVAENGKSRHKEGCGGPGGMCCCPCGALKSSADGESKKKMEKVVSSIIFLPLMSQQSLMLCV